LSAVALTSQHAGRLRPALTIPGFADELADVLGRLRHDGVRATVAAATSAAAPSVVRPAASDR